MVLVGPHADEARGHVDLALGKLVGLDLVALYGCCYGSGPDAQSLVGCRGRHLLDKVVVDSGPVCGIVYLVTSVLYNVVWHGYPAVPWPSSLLQQT